MSVLTDPRKPFADALRTAGMDFNRPGVVTAFDDLMDKAGISRASSAAPVSDDPIPADYFTLLAKIESGNRPMVKAKTSSASGLFQFIRTTWIGEGGKWGPVSSLAFGGLKPSIEEQTQRARSFTMKNVAALKNAGVAINSATLYAAHFLGAGTAVKMLRAPLEADAARIAGQPAAKANPSILGNGRTVAGFRQWLEKKTGVKP